MVLYGVIMDRRVQTIIYLMQENLSEEFPFDKVAKTLNLSPSHLRHLFKSETGMAPVRFLKYLRMQKAKDLAETTFLNVKEIMISLGINDESHFVRDFKKTFGLTITAYRGQGFKTSNAKE